jgi:hypothetical protein
VLCVQARMKEQMQDVKKEALNQLVNSGNARTHAR